MSISIMNNISSLSAQRNLNTTQGSLETSLRRLSSGMRITSAADDAAGLAISEKLRSQVNGLNQAARNAQDGISMIQTAEGAMAEHSSMLQRMRQLAVQAANSTLSDTDRGSINTELQQLSGEMNSISDRTTFNGQKLLTGSLSTQVASNSAVNTGTVVIAGTNTSITGVDVSGAKASSTFTLSAGANAGDVVLSDGVNSQQLTLGAVAAGGSQGLNFDKLGVKFSVSSVAGDTAANIATPAIIER